MTLLVELDEETFCEKHIPFLVEMCKKDYGGTTPAMLVAQAMEGTVKFWSFAGGQGLFVTKVLGYPMGKELLVEGFAGEGIFEKRVELITELRKIAKDLHCRYIGGFSQVPENDQVYLRLGMLEVGKRFLMEA